MKDDNFLDVEWRSSKLNDRVKCVCLRMLYLEGFLDKVHFEAAWGWDDWIRKRPKTLSAVSWKSISPKGSADELSAFAVPHHEYVLSMASHWKISINRTFHFPEFYYFLTLVNFLVKFRDELNNSSTWSRTLELLSGPCLVFAIFENFESVRQRLV